MTFKELYQIIKDLHAEIELAMEEDSEVNIGGNGVNAFEAARVTQYLLEEIEQNA